MLDTLIVEDNATFREGFKEFLSDRYPFMRIEKASDGDQALKIVEAGVPDLVFMDIRLPGVNGLELTRKIKAEHPNTRIIVVTSFDNPEYRNAAAECGADHFFPKSSILGKEFAEAVERIASNLGIH